jgi:dihydroneopterin aldolase
MAKAGTQILTLTGLRFDANLGILDHEKTAPQPIAVDAELNLGTQPLLPRDDDILHVLDYRKVRKIIIDECTAQHVNLLESLIGKLAHRLMQAARRAGRAGEDRQAGDLRRLRACRDPHRDRPVVIGACRCWPASGWRQPCW